MNAPRFVGIFLSLAFSQILAAEPLVQTGQSVAFLGDSITQNGSTYASGYVRLVEAGLKANGIEVKIIPAGISGNKSDQMLERLQKDVLDKKPDWMTLSCGVNDVWQGNRGVSLEEYQKNITAIVDRCTQAGVKVVILTATPINETVNENNKKLAGYNDFLKRLAAERHLVVADLNAAVWAELQKPTHPRSPGNFLTLDGVHMNPFGNQIMAAGVLEAFGLDASQIAKARASWQTLPVVLKPTGEVTLADYEKIAALAAQQKKSVNDVVGEALASTLQKMVAPSAAVP